MSGERSAEWLRGQREALRTLLTRIGGKRNTMLATWGSYTATDVEAIIREELDILAAEAREATQPTAAEVVEACRVALERLDDLAYDWVNEAGSAAHALANTAQHRAEAEARQEFEACRTAAIAIIARWKEANGGNPGSNIT